MGGQSGPGVLALKRRAKRDENTPEFGQGRPPAARMNHQVTQAAVVGVNVLVEAMERIGPQAGPEDLAHELRTGGVNDAGPALSQKFAWGPQKNDPDLGARVEYMFKLTSTDTRAGDDGAPNGFSPDPDRFVIVDAFD